LYDGDIASVLVTEQQIGDKIVELSRQVATDYAQRCPGTGRSSDLLLVGVLKGR